METPRNAFRGACFRVHIVSTLGALGERGSRQRAASIRCRRKARGQAGTAASGCCRVGYNPTNLGVRSSNLFGRANLLLRSMTHKAASARAHQCSIGRVYVAHAHNWLRRDREGSRLRRRFTIPYIDDPWAIVRKTPDILMRSFRRPFDHDGAAVQKGLISRFSEETADRFYLVESE